MWAAEDCPVTIEYSLETLDQIRARAVEAFSSFAHGGLEIGGVLYGTREGGVVHVSASAELACEHRLGPGFVLSENDQAGFARLRRAPAGMEAVGWYCSHTRNGLTLSPNDQVLFDSYFPHTGRVALVVLPARSGSAQATFFFRNASGELTAPPADAVFTLEPSHFAAAEPEPAPAPEAAPAVPNGRPAGEAAAVWPAEAQPMAEPPRPEPAAPRTRSWQAPTWLARREVWIGLAVVAGAAVLGALMRAPSARLGLQAYGVAPGQVRIEWNRAAPTVRAASSGVLEIQDGASHLQFALTPEELRSSSITYAQHSGSVQVRLRLAGNKGATPPEESIRFVGAPVQPAEPVQAAAMEPLPSAPEPQPAPTPAVTLESAPALERDSSADRMAPEPMPAPPPRKIHRAFVVPAIAAVAPPAPVPLPAPPVATPAPAHSLALPVAAVVPALYSGPQSGRIIWTGTLARRGVVEIDGTHASVGSLNGRLPSGVPLSLRVSPAQFGSGGLVVFTNDAARHGRREAPGGANGWNATEFEWDPERAGQVVVLESPAPQNDFKRLVLRSDARRCSVLVIEWTVR